MENRYDFCKRLLEVHKKDRRDMSLTPASDEFAFSSPTAIIIPRDANEVIRCAAKDFCDYLFQSQCVSAYISYGEGEAVSSSVTLRVNRELGEASERRGHRITVKDSVLVEGFDDCGVMEALFHLEDIMNLARAPFLKIGTETRRIMFYPRVVQSGYGANEYPDEYLALLAHNGFSAIALWIKGPNETLKGYTNFTDIATRAARYGIGVFIQSFAKHDVYPEGEQAQEYYDHLYADLFKEFPFIRGLSIVGEAVKFQTRDKTLPEGTKPGWWPCSDWPLLLKMIRRAVDKINPEVCITLSSYNWGYTDVERRQQLIKSLPDGVTLSCGWEMFEYYDLDGAREQCSDYSLRIAGPGYYFKTEAEAAKERGVPLRTTANTGGKTWDFGAIPYVPAPYRWAERFEFLRHEYKYGTLSELTDSIHYGVYPSFITEIAKWAFAEPRVDLNEYIPKILAMHFGDENLEKVDRAMHLVSDAVANNVPTNEDQYGALRIGPSHPFYSEIREDLEARPPQDKFAMHKLGPGMISFNYQYMSRGDEGDVRIPKEIAAFEKERDLLYEAYGVLSSIENPNDELARLTNMVHFMYRTVLTALNRKHYFLLTQKKNKATDNDIKNKIIEEMIALLEVEKENAIASIPIVEFDSVIGFEPSMEYVTDRYRIEWKISQVDAEIEKLRNELQ